MKKFTLLFVVMTFIGTQALYAQSKIKVGGSLGYSTQIGSVGIGLDGVYNINDKIDAAADFTYYIENDYVSWITIDANGHYLLMEKDKTNVYGLGGLGLIIGTVNIPELEMFGYGSSSYSRICLNLGGGATHSLTDKLSLMGEAKLAITNGSYLNLRVGVLYSL
ncbi:MAG: outer membrane beta-barrel protein [Bacteroidales bacterium]|nr:outer membrane beta-barrel protein [Bacteroidales bacterium]